jgi:hypothetical protein
MKSTKVGGDAGFETRVVILDSGEEAFATLTKFANDAKAYGGLLSRPSARLKKRRLDGSTSKIRRTKRSRSRSSAK